jgi:hypothetical protein
LDYLLATMDFVMHYDRAVLLLASNEAIDQALAEAEKARENGGESKPAFIAANAYGRLVAAGMQEAVLAFTRKLTTRCDFGVLATINVKPLPLYLNTLGRLEEFMTAVPPREVTASADDEGVWIEWTRSPKAAGYHLYRAEVESKESVRVNAKPLQAATFMFVDRPEWPGKYRYTVSAIDENGAESPHSHFAVVAFKSAVPPRITANKPASTLDSARPLPVRVVATGERAITAVRLHFRYADDPRWTVLPMQRRFRNSYQAAIPAERIEPGILLFFVDAIDADGHTACWPDTAGQELYWSASVLPARA